MFEVILTNTFIQDLKRSFDPKAPATLPAPAPERHERARRRGWGERAAMALYAAFRNGAL